MNTGKSATKRRLLIVNTVAQGASTASLGAECGVTAAREGYDVMFAYGRGEHPDRPGVAFRRISPEWEVAAHGALTRAFDMHGYGSPVATERLIRLIKDFDPDVVHLHNLHGYYLNPGRLFGSGVLRGRRVVLTLHDIWLLTGHCPFPTVASCRRYTHGCHDCPLRGEYPASLLADRSARNYAHRRAILATLKEATLVCVSRWQYDIFRQELGADFDLQIVANGIDTALFTPEAAVGRMARSVVGVARVWDERKGLSDFLALRRVLPADFSITLIGLSDRQIRDLPQGIHGVQSLSPQGIAAEFASAGIMVHPSRGEASGLVMLEALACGTPVITYAGSGSEELIVGNPGIGRCVRPGDIEAMAQAAIQLSQLDTAAREQCRRVILDGHSLEQMCRSYLDLYSL